VREWTEFKDSVPSAANKEMLRVTKFMLKSASIGLKIEPQADKRIEILLYTKAVVGTEIWRIEPVSPTRTIAQILVVRRNEV
jgi:hypothetical protein